MPGLMPLRATKRGLERTPLNGSRDVLICGASFAGLAVARELSGSGARVLVLDRYEIGERPTCGAGIPTHWLPGPGLMGASAPRALAGGAALFVQARHPPAPRNASLIPSLDLLVLRPKGLDRAGIAPL